MKNFKKLFSKTFIILNIVIITMLMFSTTSLAAKATPCSSCDGHGKTECETCYGSSVVDCTDCWGVGFTTCQECVDGYCPICWGNGKQECPNCNGNKKCDSCDGQGHEPNEQCDECTNGKITCQECNGTGVCPTCNGEDPSCDDCNGDGVCWNCGGDKIEDCMNCEGDGIIEGMECPICNGTGNCDICKGSGTVNCDLCGGNGKCPVCGGNYEHDCPTCVNGFVACTNPLCSSGFVTCTTCSGAGYNVSWYKGHESDSSYTLNNVNELEELAALVNSGISFENKTITLAKKFDNSEAMTTPIGNSAHSFLGTFNGNMHNIKLNISNETYAGLFGFVDNSTILNVSTSGTISGSYVGGIVGQMRGTTSNIIVKNCSSTCKISATVYGGGLVGYVRQETSNNSVNQILNCYATGELTAGNSGTTCIGGIVGYFCKGASTATSTSLTLNNCYSACNINCIDSCAGGFVGKIMGIGYGEVRVLNCYCSDLKGSTNGSIVEDAQMKAASGTINQNWSNLSGFALVDILNSNIGFISDAKTWSAVIELPEDCSDATKEAFNYGYPVFAENVDCGYWLNLGTAYNGLMLSCSMPEGISYKASGDTAVYTFENVLIPEILTTYPSIGILDANAIIILKGQNQLGSNIVLDCIRYENEATYGIKTTGNLTFTGDGNLIIFDDMAGITAKNITFDENFTGKITIYDQGSHPSCCLITTEDIIIKNGTFELNNYATNGISARNLTIEDGNLEVTGGHAAVNVSQSFKAKGALISANEEKDCSGTNYAVNISNDGTVSILDSLLQPAAARYLEIAFKCDFDNRFSGDITKENYTDYVIGNEYTVHDSIKYTFAGWYTGIDGSGDLLTGSPKGGVKYYAKWTKNGKTVVTTPLDFTTSAYEIPSNSGITWTNFRTLTLNDTIIDIYGDYTRAVVLPTTSTIIFSGDSTINLKNTSGDPLDNAVAIKCGGELTISGDGILTVNSDSINGNAWGVEVCTKLIFENATLNVNSKNDAINVLQSGSELCLMAIYSGKISTNVTETRDSGNNGITVQSGIFAVQSGDIETKGGCHGIVAGDISKATPGYIGIVDGRINASATNTGIWAYTNIYVYGGNITAKATGTTSSDYGIYARTGDIIISGDNAVVTAESNSNTSGNQYGVNVKNGTLTIRNATLVAKGNTASIMSSGDITVEGTGKIITNSKIKSNAPIGDKLDKCYTVVSGDTDILNGQLEIAPSGDNTMEIKLVKYIITVRNYSGDSESGDTFGYLSPDDDLFNVAPVEGYKFIGFFKDETCKDAWNFENDYLRRDITLYSGFVEEIKSVTSQISGTVFDNAVTPNRVSDAVVELWQGDAKLDATQTNDNGEFTFSEVTDGIYNIVVKKGNQVTTQFCTIPSSTLNIILPDVSTILESNDTGSIVDGLTNIPANNADIIKLAVESEEENSGDSAQNAISELAPNSKELTYISILLTKNDNDIGITNETVLTIIVPYDTTRKNIRLYRYHDETSLKLTKEKEKMAIPVDGHYYVDTENKLIYIYASKFSTYAIGYAISESAPAREYEISLASTKNGSIIASSTSATQGTKITITVDPDKGYTLETLLVEDDSGKEVTITGNDNKYTFKMPSSDVEISATFMEDNTMLNYFTDVNANAYYYDAVLWAADNGITSGIDNLHFGPNAVTNRAQMVTFLWRMAGSPEPTTSTSKFTDVEAGSYYEKAVLWAVENKITEGTSETTFSPDMSLKRAHTVTFLYRFAGSKNADTENKFTDVKTDAYYYNAVLWAVANGITSGTGETTFAPDTDCTRCQIVTFLYRYSQK